jgi:hypothetical protein
MNEQKPPKNPAGRIFVIVAIILIAFVAIASYADSKDKNHGRGDNEVPYNGFIRYDYPAQYK